MQNFQDTIEACNRSFISAFPIFVTVHLIQFLILPRANETLEICMPDLFQRLNKSKQF